MSTPSERIWTRRDRWDAGAGLEAYLPAEPRDLQTLAQVASRVRAGVPLRETVADFLDDVRYVRGPQDLASRLSVEPESVDAHTDAYLAATAEHLAAQEGIPAPAWVRAEHRFLDHLWWPSPFPALRARAIVESPAAFRRRGIFIGRTTMQRV